MAILRVSNISGQVVPNLKGLKSAYLQHEVPPPEVCDGAWQAGPPPHEPQEERPLPRAQLLQHLPEPVAEGGVRLHPFVCCDSLQQVDGDVRAAAHLCNEKGGGYY